MLSAFVCHKWKFLNWVKHQRALLFSLDDFSMKSLVFDPPRPEKVSPHLFETSRGSEKETQFLDPVSSLNDRLSPVHVDGLVNCIHRGFSVPPGKPQLSPGLLFHCSGILRNIVCS